MNPATTPMPTKLERMVMAAAILACKAQKRRIEAQIAEVRQTIEAESHSTAVDQSQPRRRMSRAARARIAAAQRKRWAETRRQPVAVTGQLSPAAAKKERRVSAAGRRRIIEATRQGWARMRAERVKASAALSMNPIASRTAVARTTEKGSRKRPAKGRSSTSKFAKARAAAQ
jgi:hypothetical protein